MNGQLGAIPRPSGPGQASYLSIRGKELAAPYRSGESLPFKGEFFKPALESLLTKKERKIRKRWLFYMLFLLGIRIVMVGIAAFGAKGKAELLDALVIGFICCLLFFLVYLFCYRNTTTFLLTLALVVGFTSFLYFLAINFALLWAMGGISILFFALCVPLMMLQGLYFYGLWLTMKLRRINKVLRCHEKFPMESEELIQAMRSHSDLEELGIFFKRQIKEKPFLKPLLRREKNLFYY